MCQTIGLIAKTSESSSDARKPNIPIGLSHQEQDWVSIDTVNRSHEMVCYTECQILDQRLCHLSADLLNGYPRHNEDSDSLLAPEYDQTLDRMC
jgi:hypothetical protein